MLQAFALCEAQVQVARFYAVVIAQVNARILVAVYALLNRGIQAARQPHLHAFFQHDIDDAATTRCIEFRRWCAHDLDALNRGRRQAFQHRGNVRIAHFHFPAIDVDSGRRSAGHEEIPVLVGNNAGCFFQHFIAVGRCCRQRLGVYDRHIAILPHQWPRGAHSCAFQRAPGGQGISK